MNLDCRGFRTCGDGGNDDGHKVSLAWAHSQKTQPLLPGLSLKLAFKTFAVPFANHEIR